MYIITLAMRLHVHCMFTLTSNNNNWHTWGCSIALHFMRITIHLPLRIVLRRCEHVFKNKVNVLISCKIQENYIWNLAPQCVHFRDHWYSVMKGRYALLLKLFIWTALIITYATHYTPKNMHTKQERNLQETGDRFGYNRKHVCAATW